MRIATGINALAMTVFVEFHRPSANQRPNRVTPNGFICQPAFQSRIARGGIPAANIFSTISFS